MFYSALKAAIQSRTCVSCGYRGFTRHICPHSIGTDDRGTPRVLAYQYGGENADGRPQQGRWQCLDVRGISGVVENDDRWPASLDAASPNGCVTNVEMTVPTEHPSQKTKR